MAASTDASQSADRSTSVTFIVKFCSMLVVKFHFLGAQWTSLYPHLRGRGAQ